MGRSPRQKARTYNESPEKRLTNCIKINRSANDLIFFTKNRTKTTKYKGNYYSTYRKPLIGQVVINYGSYLKGLLLKFIQRVIGSNSNTMPRCKHKTEWETPLQTM